LPDLAPLAALCVLIEIAAGTFLLSHLLDIWGKIGRGFTGTTALICAVVAGLAFLIAINLPSPATLLTGLGDADLSSVVHWLAALVIALVVDALFAAVGTNIARYVISSVAAVIAAITVIKLAVLLGAATGGAGVALTALLPATMLCGTAWAGMLLGHWYLVSPNLSFKPLRQAVGLIFAAIVVEVAAIVVALLSGTSASRASVISGDDALLFWLLVVGSGVVFTAAVTGLTYYFARIRANQPATAMLYVLIISVLMGVIPASLVYLQTSVPV
jgi:hypothetical protein